MSRDETGPPLARGDRSSVCIRLYLGLGGRGENFPSDKRNGCLSLELSVYGVQMVTT